MEESKELQKMYVLFRSAIYLSIIVEILVFVPLPVTSFIKFIIERISTFEIYNNLINSKIATLIIVIITCLGTKAKKDLNFDANKMVVYPVLIGVFVLALSVLSYYKFIDFFIYLSINLYFYIFLSFIGIILIHIGLDNLSKYIRSNLGKDRFNIEQESFEQTQDIVENQYSVNIPTQFYYNGRFRNGYINIIDPFRGTWVLGTPGSGKTFGIIEPFIRQHSAKGFTMVVYDYKFPTLARKVYYHYNLNKKKNRTPNNCKFNIINFANVEYSNRVNPIQKRYINTLAAASETASTLIEALQKGKADNDGNSSSDFFKKAAENFLAGIIYFFIRYENGRYSDMAHVLSFLNLDYSNVFDMLMMDEELVSLLSPFSTAFKNKAMDQLEGMVGTLRVNSSRMATKESYWIFSGDDFNLKVSDPKNPSYLVIANDPDIESVSGTLNALILNRLVTQVNTGEGKNVPVDIIVDELPTLYFHKIDRLIGTARSNRVAVTLGFQELPQLEGDYGKIGMQKVVNVCANLICASARSKETLEWLQNDIFGKVKQVKEGISITDNKTTISYNENLEYLIPASKIADMPTGFLCGQTARNYVKTDYSNKKVDISKIEEFKTTKFFAKTNFDLNAIAIEEANYKELPKIYDFGTIEDMEKLLSENFRRINKEVDEIAERIMAEVKIKEKAEILRKEQLAQKKLLEDIDIRKMAEQLAKKN